jgi:hypothetical protein
MRGRPSRIHDHSQGLEAGISHILWVKGPVYVDSLEQGVHDGHHPSLVHYPISRTTTAGLIPKLEQ